MKIDSVKSNFDDHLIEYRYFNIYVFNMSYLSNLCHDRNIETYILNGIWII